jgi:hypothetical protein
MTYKTEIGSMRWVTLKEDGGTYRLADRIEGGRVSGITLEQCSFGNDGQFYEVVVWIITEEGKKEFPSVVIPYSSVLSYCIRETA